ncbi:Hypothetical predicted protein [Olea europaea subsp. europaea]|uniref:Uncharacterized protein n=1 Tax=Olea europaea subsp. europaea TaxID=158383 RepID=A0A8S0TNH7_OLEEU|nr:Hypothetical predicted protein [Olea europaea subsp. europaea]
MESEISRRILEDKKFISPGALKRDQPVCEGGAGGKPYTGSDGCVPAPSNTHHRGCEQYYRCRDNSEDSLILWNQVGRGCPMKRITFG